MTRGARGWASGLVIGAAIGALLLACQATVPAGPDLSFGGDLSGAPLDDGRSGDDAAFAARYDWYGVIGTGQSLAVGARGLPPLSTAPSNDGLMLVDDGPDPKFPLDGSGRLRVAPLVEPPRSSLAGYLDDQYPNNIYGETPHSSLARQLALLGQRDLGRALTTAHTIVGWSGHRMTDIDKTGTGRAYPGSLMEARAFLRAAQQRGLRLGFAAVVLTHGESDWDNDQYGSQVERLQRDYDADLRALTGQPEPVVMLATQEAGYPGSSLVQPRSPVLLWQASQASQGRIVLVGPKYQYPYHADGLHLTAAGYVRLGEKLGQVLHQVVMLGRPFVPLQPLRVIRDARTVRVDFQVPVPPLAFEATLAPPHQSKYKEWARGRGFEVEDDDGPVLISDAKLVPGEDAVVLTLARDLKTGAVVRYAQTQDADIESGGTPLGRRGQLRDSDPFEGADAETAPCQALTGSPVLRCGALHPARQPSDLVSGPGIPDGTLVKSVAAAGSGIQLTLSQPCGNLGGPDGLIPVRLRHDHRNYAIQFELPIP